ncbi:Beta 1,4-N-acetylgalactosaminyltransferase [Operophtera brumata]|uniref:Beta 1,4-N-acetylgalactosaminyltransferase n=1 Tax=Operophtera brumata TaxID=104452 RepID=A0A0L7LFZ3_OPEBR|nr:Beta 1,4-N-acetylgalactosaminyltransferase [Operophtera brumata]
MQNFSPLACRQLVFTVNQGGGSRALRLLLLLVLTLAAVEFLFGGILESSPLRTYLYTPVYNSTQPTIRSIADI